MKWWISTNIGWWCINRSSYCVSNYTWYMVLLALGRAVVTNYLTYLFGILLLKLVSLLAWLVFSVSICLQEFHRKFYHPSNSRIWFYGDDDPNERLRILSGAYSFISYNFRWTWMVLIHMFCLYLGILLEWVVWLGYSLLYVLLGCLRGNVYLTKSLTCQCQKLSLHQSEAVIKYRWVLLVFWKFRGSYIY